jgi:hypothetical protein
MDLIEKLSITVYIQFYLAVAWRIEELTKSTALMLFMVRGN